MKRVPVGAAAVLALGLLAARAKAAPNEPLALLHGLAQQLGASDAPDVPAPAPNPRPNASASASVRNYHAVLEQSSVVCQGQKGPFKPTATFTNYDVHVSVDAGDPARSQLQVTVQTGSVVSTSWYVSTDFLRQELQVARYPTATLRSLAIRATTEPESYDADVEIVLMGDTYHKTFPIRLAPEGQDWRVSGTVSLTLDNGTSVVETYDILLRLDAAALNVRSAR